MEERFPKGVMENPRKQNMGRKCEHRTKKQNSNPHADLGPSDLPVTLGPSVLTGHGGTSDIQPHAEILMLQFLPSRRSAGYASLTSLKTFVRADVGDSLNGNDVMATGWGKRLRCPSTDDSTH